MKRKLSEILIPVISLIVVIGLWSLSFVAITNYLGGPDKPELWAKRGQLGDMFGSVNALFSGLAFAGIIYTIYLQRQELRLTREEFKKQNETLWLQRFENTFFNLLTSHQRLLETLKLTERITSTKKNEYKGREIFDEIMKILNSRLAHIEVNEQPKQEEIEILRPVFHTGIMKFEGLITLYVQSLHSVLYFTANSDLLIKSERAQYFQIIEAQLNYNERAFIFYYLSLGDPELTSALFSLHKIEKQFHFIGFSDGYLLRPSHSNLQTYWANFD